MRNWVSQLDRLLRGDVTRPETLQGGGIDVRAGGLAVLIVLLGAIYGLCMGSYSLLKEVPANLVDTSQPYMQLIATSVKVPALFYLTLLVTFPSLYVFNALVGSRLSLVSVLRLLVASLAVNLAVLSSLGPIVLFFSMSTKSYAFILLLNIVVFGAAGVLGLTFLLQTLHRLTIAVSPGEVKPTATDPPADGDESPSALDMPSGQVLGRHTRLVFSCWVVLFGLVGAQMGWVLRPFVGAPGLPFEWLRVRQSNFFEAALHALGTLLTGGG
jgi:hypothetical protein